MGWDGAESPEINLGSGRSHVSTDGRYIAFESAASLTPGGVGGGLYVRDRLLLTTVQASIGYDGADAAGGDASISADGRSVAFVSLSRQLAPGDENGTWDVFVRNLDAATTTRVSVSSEGMEGEDRSGGPSISADGRIVAFASEASNLVPGDTNDESDVFVHDLLTGRTIRASVGVSGAEGNGRSATPDISADGRFVAFESWASNLVPGDTNGWGDIFVRDLEAGTTTRVSVASDGQQGAFDSYNPAISGDGRSVAFLSNTALAPEDRNRFPDIYVWDRLTGAQEVVSVTSDGLPGFGFSFHHPSISPDGRYIVFTWVGAPLTPAGGPEVPPGPSPGGVVADFVYLRDRVARTTTLVSVDSSGSPVCCNSYPSLSADGRFVAFTSGDPNVVPGDTNDTSDVFVRDRGEETCPGGVREEGWASTRLRHDGESGPIGGLIHDVSCNHLAPRGF